MMLNSWRSSWALVAALAIGSAPGCKREETPDPVPAEATPEASAPTESAGSGSPQRPAETAEAEADEAPAVQPVVAPPTPVVDRRPDVEANRELAARLGLAPPDPLLVSDLLTRADVRELARFRGELLETSLDGVPASPTYNTIRLQADGGYGFALQLWQHDEIRQASAQFRRIRDTYFDQELDPAGVANEAFVAAFMGIRHYGFMHRASKSIAMVTCDAELCDGTQIRALAQRVANRL